MFKTQLYIPDETNTMLDEISKTTGTSKSQLLRRAIAEFLQKYDKGKLEKAFGMWARYNIDLRGLRSEWER
jgi:hypothetical protein